MNHISDFNTWNNKQSLNELNNNFPNYNKKQFIENTFSYLNESNIDSQKWNILYALYEADSLFNKKKNWFNSVNDENKPMILISKTHTLIVFENDFFAITNESFNILYSDYINENIFSDAWDSVSNFVSDAWGGIKSVGNKVGDWVSDLSDSAKAVTGFVKLSYMATSAMQSDDWKVIANTIFNITHVLATTYAKSFNLSESILAQVNSSCSGIINLWDGRNLFLESWKAVSNPETIKEEDLAKSVKEITPDSFIGVTKMLIGVSDLGKASNPSAKYENLTDLEKVVEDDFTSKIKSSSENLTKEGDGVGLSKSIIEISNQNILGTDKKDNMWKSYVLCQIAFGLENTYPEMKKDALDALAKANEYIPKAKDFPNMVQKWIETAEKTKLEGGMGIVQDAIKTMGKPMIETTKRFTETTLPELMNTAEWMGVVSTNYNKGVEVINKNCKPSKTNIKIPTLPSVEKKSDDVKLASNDINTINKNLSKIAQDSGIEKKTEGSVKESMIISFKEWTTNQR